MPAIAAGDDGLGRLGSFGRIAGLAVMDLIRSIAVEAGVVVRNRGIGPSQGILREELGAEEALRARAEPKHGQAVHHRIDTQPAQVRAGELLEPAVGVGVLARPGRKTLVPA